MTQDTSKQTEPDHLYDPDDWETTYNWEDRDEAAIASEIAVCDVKRFATLVAGPDKFAAIIPLSFDAEGDPDERETQWFDSEEDARAAIAKAYAEGRDDDGSDTAALSASEAPNDR